MSLDKGNCNNIIGMEFRPSKLKTRLNKQSLNYRRNIPQLLSKNEYFSYTIKHHITPKLDKKAPIINAKNQIKDNRKFPKTSRNLYPLDSCRNNSVINKEYSRKISFPKIKDNVMNSFIDKENAIGKMESLDSFMPQMPIKHIKGRSLLKNKIGCKLSLCNEQYLKRQNVSNDELQLKVYTTLTQLLVKNQL